MEKDLHIPQQASNPRTPWDMLSLSDKSDMIRIAIDNGVLNLTDIRDKYNEFAKGGYVPSKEVKGRITNWEGAAMTGAKDPLSGKYLKNDTFEAEAERFAQALPESIRDKVLNNPELADHLYSYSYNVGAGAFKKRVVPALERYYSGKGSLQDIAHSMWASGDSKLRGLRRRRDVEKAGVMNALTNEPVETPVSTFVYNPYQLSQANTTLYPTMVPDENSYVTAHQLTETERRKQKLQEHIEAIENFNNLMQLVGIQNNPLPSFVSTNPLLGLMGQSYAEGGLLNYPITQFGNGGGYTVGEQVDAIYQTNPREEFLGEPAHHYDFTQSDEWANAHGYYPDARGHRDDRVKKPAHPSHPSRGTWNGDQFVLTDLGMQNPNYTLFGLNDGGQDPQAVLTYQGGVILPEITVTPKENYIFNPYDNIILHQKAEGGGIHIKPENKGKFTALKERTGHSATWFKEHGTPAQKKMATFALNARHWKHGLGGNLFEGGGETSAFDPLKHPKIPVTPEDQEATNWIANWYNQRREQLYNNAKDYNSFLVMNDDAKDRRFGLPIGKSAADRAYYEKLRNMAQYKTASFEDLKEDEPDNYAAMRDEDVAYTSQNGTIYYNDPAMMFIELQKPNNPGFSLMGTHIHERTHSSGNPGKNNNLIGYNAQTAALKNIIKLKKGLVEGELDTYPEIYGRMMEFRYNHNMNPRKKYTSKEIQKMLDQEDKIINSALQRYDLESLTKALNDVAQGNVQSGDTFLPIYL